MGESLPGFKNPVPITFHSKRDAVPPNSVILGVISLVLPVGIILSGPLRKKMCLRM